MRATQASRPGHSDLGLALTRRIARDRPANAGEIQFHGVVAVAGPVELPAFRGLSLPALQLAGRSIGKAPRAGARDLAWHDARHEARRVIVSRGRELAVSYFPEHVY